MNWIEDEDFSWMKKVDYQPYEEIKMTGHNIRMGLGLVIVFIIGGIQALKGLNWVNGIETILPVLLSLEHVLEGNTGE